MYGDLCIIGERRADGYFILMQRCICVCRRAVLQYVLLPCLRFAPVEWQVEVLSQRIPHLLAVTHRDSRPGNIPGLRK